ncbi:hypothetical protein DH2020_018211 [Rehmannia glutinosa]|uniref:Uncharacterized protein n=1 Tax=Rehmannia glutinosa TaxID=99300 RepID=A0ABR0WLQ4_REHGL
MQLCPRARALLWSLLRKPKPPTNNKLTTDEIISNFNFWVCLGKTNYQFFCALLDWKCGIIWGRKERVRHLQYLNRQVIVKKGWNHKLGVIAFHVAGNSSVPGLHMASKRPFNNFRPPRGGFQGRNRGRGRFFRGGNSKLICQIYAKYNHIAAKCFKRYDPNFTGLDTSLSSAPPGFMHPQANFVASPYHMSNISRTQHTEASKPPAVFLRQQPGSQALLLQRLLQHRLLHGLLHVFFCLQIRQRD